MALQTPVVTEVSVTEPQERLYVVTFNLTIADDEVGYAGINQNFPVKSKIPDYGTSVIVDEASVIKQMQVVIDDYEKNKVVNKSLSASVTNIQAGLVV